MAQLLELLPLKTLARSLKTGFGKLPVIGSEVASLAPNETTVADETAPFAGDDAAALEARVMQILRMASKAPPGPQRRDALADAGRARQKAIELRRRASAELKAQIEERRPGPSSPAGREG